MKGKLWELGPFVVAALVGLYILTARLKTSGVQPAPAVEGVAHPRRGLTPHASSGPGDPTRPEDFLPDPNSKPDPYSLPDPTASTATRGAPPKR